MCLTFLCFLNLGGRQTRTRREQRASSHSSQKWKELRSEPMGAWFAVKYNGDQWRIYGSTLEKHRYIWLHQNFFILREIQLDLMFTVNWAHMFDSTTLLDKATYRCRDFVYLCDSWSCSGSSKIFNENSNAWIAWIHQWYWNSYYNLILQKFTRFQSIPHGC